VLCSGSSPVERTFATARSIEFDAIVVADGAPTDGDFRAIVMLQEAFRHLKALGAWGDGVEVLAAAGIDPEASGVLTGKKASAKMATGLIAALGTHRAWDRTPLGSRCEPGRVARVGGQPCGGGGGYGPGPRGGAT
jgi:catalase